MSSFIATIQPFDLDNNEDWTEYSERFDNFLIANKVTENDLKRATFLASIGASAYKLLRSLCQNKPNEKTYVELKKLMQDHLKPKPNEIAERFRFFKRDRKTGESVNQYIAELRKASEHCGFADKLDEYLRDRFVCGLNCEKIQQRLLSEENLDLAKALKIAIGFESAGREAKNLQSQGSHETVHHIGGQQQGRRECYKCGNLKHLANNCPFRNKECYGCGKRGHPKWIYYIISLFNNG